MIHSSFEEALVENNPICLIPSQFSVHDQNLKKVLVRVGEEDKNECLAVGKSATKEPKAHVFNYKGIIFNID